MYHHRSANYLFAFAAGAAAWAVFGDKIMERMNENKYFREMKVQINEKLIDVKDLTQEKYELVVDEVSQDYAKVKGISENELVDLVEDLKMHWGRIKKAWGR